MEELNPEYSSRQPFEMPLEPNKMSGFLKRWRNKLFKEQKEEQKPNVEKPEQVDGAKTIIAKAALKNQVKKPLSVLQQNIIAEAAPRAEVLQPIEKIKRVGRRVLNLADSVLKETTEKPVKPEFEAVVELKAAKTHLTKEIKELKTQEIKLRTGSLLRDDALVTVEKAEPKPAKAEKRKEAKKETLIDIAITAIFATAGGAVLLIPAQERYLEKRAPFENKKTKQRTLRLERLLRRQELLSEQTTTDVAQQAEVLAQQEIEITELKQQAAVEKTAATKTEYIQDVAQLTEKQADLTHEFVEKVIKPEATRETKEYAARTDKKETVKPKSSIERAQPSTASKGERELKSVKNNSGIKAVGGVGLATNFADLPKQVQEKLKQAAVDLQKPGKKYKKDHWLARAFFATVVTIATIWIISQVIYMSL